MATLKLRIQGMSGRADEDRIETALRQEPGVLGAIANRAGACAEIEYEDDEASLEHLLDLVRRLGYPAELCG